MAVDVEALLAPVSEDSPAGPDRRYSEARVEIDKFFDEDVDQAAPADSAEAATNRSGRLDTKGLIRLLLDEMRQTKDLELGVHLARAGLAAVSLDTAAAGAEVTAGLLERYWETMHPDLDSSEVLGRQNICQVLASEADFVRPLKNLPVIRHARLGDISVADLADLAQDGQGSERYGLFRAMVHGDAEHQVTGVGTDAVSAVQADMSRLSEALGAIGRRLSEQGGSIDLQTVQAVLTQAQAGLEVLVGGAAPASTPVREAADGSAPTAMEAASGVTSGSYSGVVKNRQDVVAAIDAICQYYERHEPASPVPLALTRAKAWVRMSFLDILKDIVPGSLGDAQTVLGQTPEADE